MDLTGLGLDLQSPDMDSEIVPFSLHLFVLTGGGFESRFSRTLLSGSVLFDVTGPKDVLAEPMWSLIGRSKEK